MKKFLWLLLIIILFILLTSCSSKITSEVDSIESINLNSFSIPFIINSGIYPDSVLYYIHIPQGKCFITESNNIHYSWRDSVNIFSFIESFTDVNPGKFKIKKKAPTKVNYFQGNDPAEWHSNISTAKSLEYQNIYDQIDLELKAANSNIEKIFIIHPNSNPDDIRMKLSEICELKINELGELEVKLENEIFRFTKPKAYQYINSTKKKVDVKYQILANNLIGFSVGDFNKKYNLIIDPLIASTYVGGSELESRGEICLDEDNNIYLFGQSFSDDIPFPANAYIDTLFNEYDAAPVILKISCELTELLAATFIRGSEDDGGRNICIGPSGNIYVTGDTDSEDFPVTPNAYCTTLQSFSGDIYVSCLTPDLSTLLYSTFIGGCSSERTTEIICDETGNIYITGQTRSSNYPTTPGAYDETFNTIINAGDAFISKFDPTLSDLLSSTFLGSTNNDVGTQMEFDENGDLFIVGYTRSSNFPTTNNAYCNFCHGWEDVFISKMDPELTTLIYSTLFGGSLTEADPSDPSFVLSDDGYVYVVGATRSDDLPVTPGAFDGTYESDFEGFIFKMTDDLSDLVACSYAGNWGYDYLYDVIIFEDNIYTCGATVDGYNLITPNAFMTQGVNGCFQGLILKLNPELTMIQTGTYLGGSDTDTIFRIIQCNDNILVLGTTESSDFPLTPNAFKTDYDSLDWFLSILDPDLSSGTSIENNEISNNNFQMQCYPNPFSLSSGQITIAFDLPQNGPVSVCIYNIKGQTVKTFRINPSTHQPINSITWDGRNEQGKIAATGTYFCRSSAGEKMYNQKFLVVK